jgi:hypothetical protein
MPIASGSPASGPNGSPRVRDHVQKSTIGAFTSTAASGAGRQAVRSSAIAEAPCNTAMTTKPAPNSHHSAK